MAHYRKIDPKIWNDEKFMSMSANGQLACLFMMTHPHMTAAGGLRSTIPGISSEHSKLPEKAFREAFAKGIAKADPEAPLIWFPNFLRYNPPESPNVCKGWVKALDYLPECQTKQLIILSIYDYLKGLSKGFMEAFREAWPHPLPHPLLNQEQEQEQEQEQDKDNPPPSGSGDPPPESKPEKEDFKPVDEKTWEQSEKLACYLLERIKDNNPEFTPPQNGAYHTWKVEIDRMIRIDKRDPERIGEIITWAVESDFWSGVVLSGTSLRKHANKITTQMNNQKRDGPHLSAKQRHNLQVLKEFVNEGASL